MKPSSLKRAVAYLEVVCFIAAWVVGVTLAVQDRESPPPAPHQRDVVVNHPHPSPADIAGPRLFRPIPQQEIQEGG